MQALNVETTNSYIEHNGKALPKSEDANDRMLEQALERMFGTEKRRT